MSRYTYPSTKPYDDKPIEIYDNDLKYKKYRNIDIGKVVEYNTDTRLSNTIEDRDTLEYRLKECQMKYNNTMLDLGHLDLETIPINKLPITLKYLFCPNNKLKYLGDLNHLANLEILDICNNELEKINELPPNLKELMCRDNKLITIDSLKKCDHLERLDCSFNNLKNIPFLKNLIILVCSNNHLTKIQEIGSLNKLICKNNNIDKLPHLYNLIELDCCNNNLKELVNYPKLKHLICNNNDIYILESLDKLESLQCCGNPIKRIPYFDKLIELLCDYETVKEINRKYKQKLASSSVNRNNELQLLFFE